MSDKARLENIDNDQQRAVVLPVEPAQFSEFISKLLGKPQTIERRVYGAFVVTRDDVANVFELVRQRISRQNEASLIQFSVRILYEDNSSVLINSYEDFLLYGEIRPMRSIGLELSWRWLIRFRDQQVPEKQEIDLSFIAERRRVIGVLEDSSPSQIHVRVSHTDRSWGSDIDLLLKGFCETTITKDGAVRRFLRLNSTKVSISTGFISFLIFGWIVAELFGAYATRQYEIASRAWLSQDTATLESISHHISYIAQRFLSSESGLFRPLQGMSFLLSAALGLALGIYTDIIVSAHRPSFVVLTGQSEERMKKEVTSYENGFRKLIATAVGGIIVAAIGRLLGEYLITLLVG